MKQSIVALTRPILSVSHARPRKARPLVLSFSAHITFASTNMYTEELTGLANSGHVKPENVGKECFKKFHMTNGDEYDCAYTYIPFDV